MQLITRSGTNQFHGSAFNYFRNEALDANDWFNNARRLPKPATRQNNFGFVLGGPILLPRFGEGGRQPGYDGRNRTFFFASYEGLRLQLPQSRSSDVPSLSARQTAPASIQPILNSYPLPNGPDRIGTNGLPNGLAAFNTSYSNPSSLDATSVRVDHTINNKLVLFGRANYSPSSLVERGQGGTRALNTLSTFGLTTSTYTVGATLSLTPTINNELRVNFSRNNGTSSYEIDSFGGAIPLSDTVFFPAGISTSDALSSINIAGSANPAIQIGTAADNLQRQINIIDNVVLSTGAHEFKFGLDYRRLAPVINPQDYFRFLQFNGVGTPGAATQPVGSALSGTAGTLFITASDRARLPLFHNFSLFGQDTWRPTQRLMITYGLRWEVNPPPTESNNNGPATVLGLDNPTDGNSCATRELHYGIQPTIISRRGSVWPTGFFKIRDERRSCAEASEYFTTWVRVQSSMRLVTLILMLRPRLSSMFLFRCQRRLKLHQQTQLPPPSTSLSPTQSFREPTSGTSPWNKRWGRINSSPHRTLLL